MGQRLKNYMSCIDFSKFSEELVVSTAVFWLGEFEVFLEIIVIFCCWNIKFITLYMVDSLEMIFLLLQY